MEKINWLVTQGKAEITDKGSTIKYIPELRKNDETGETVSVTATTRSDINFESGTITFKVILSNPIPYALCQISLGGSRSVGLNVGLNVVGALWGIQQQHEEAVSGWKLLGGAGTYGQEISANTEYDVCINVEGSNVALYINGVLATSITFQIKQFPLELFFNSHAEIIVKNFQVEAKKPKVFVIMQFTEEYNQLFEEVIKPVCDDYGLLCERADDYCSTSMIIEDITNSILESSAVIAEITPDNPNVYYEVGYAHAIKKPTILLCDKKRGSLPFDVSSFRTLFYQNTIAGKSKVENDLRRYLGNIFGK